MIKFISNKKGTILPVTIVSMFIMIVVAYTCIKMFIVQNIMSTTDQLKIRTFYAAEGAIERQKGRIYKDIKYINDSLEIDENTAIDSNPNECRIIDLVSLNPVDFKTGDFVGGVYNDVQFKTEDKMYPDINVTTKISKFTDKPWLNDCGIDFYAKKGVTINATDLYKTEGLKFSPVVYNDTSKLQSIDNGWLEKEDWIAYVDITDSSYGTVDLKTNAKILDRSAGHIIDNSKINSVKGRMKDCYPNGVRPTISFCAYKVEYIVKHSRANYIINSSANAQISHKIPTVTCNMKLYFDIFLTKLYRKFVVSKVYTCTWIAAQPTVPAHWGEWTESSPSASSPGATRDVFYSDTNYINNIKFHIQKWEVLN